MTQNERLRELLGSASGYVGHSPGCAPKYCHQCRLSNQIDAALAEPVEAEYVFRGGYIEDESGERWWSAELLAKTERERDEARAEVERLRNLLIMTPTVAVQRPCGRQQI